MQSESAIDLERENRRLREENAQIKADLRDLTAMLRFLQKSRFAPSSERHVANQPLLFNETVEVAPPVDAGDEDSEVKAHKRRKKKRPAIPAHLPRERVEHDVPESERVCPQHGVTLERRGERLVEQVEWIPAKINVTQHVLRQYACAVCDCVVKGATPPPSPIPGSMATASLLAHIATSKYADGLPLYRQESILSRHGLELTRTTMATWMVELAKILRPLHNLLSDELLRCPVIYMDETHHQALKVEGKPATAKSYFWARIGEASGRKIALFHFDPSRGGRVARDLLFGYTGFVVTDGYDGYNGIEEMPGIRRAQCWMHARRHFKKASKVLGQAGRGGIADQALERIQTLYKIERDCAEMAAEDRRVARLERSRPILEDFRPWLEKAGDDLPPKSVTAKAISYALERWEHLLVYLEDGRLRMDNSPAENAIRPVAVGRKNWLFSDSVEGAESSAVLYSIVETAKANGVEPHSYLRRVIDRLPQAQTAADVEALLPWSLASPH